jgi:hypothetical protein
MSERNVLKLDIDSLTKFQEELHLPNPNNINEKVNSRFICVLEKNAWSAHTKAKMVHTKVHSGDSDEGEIIYTASKKFDVIFKTSFHINLIPIKVKDDWKDRVEICYFRNPGHNIVNRGELKTDDDHHQYMDSIWMDIHSQFFMDNGAGKRELYDRMVGNIPCLVDWNTDLPGIPLIVPQPYHYSRHTRVGLLTLRSSMNTVTYHYNIRNKINEILRMRVRKSIKHPWEEVKCNLQYLDIPENVKEIPIPELWTRYSLMTDEEREWQKQQKIITYIEDIVIANSNNPIKFGSTDVIPLHCKVPCKALFWVAQNVRFSGNRNLSNYTTDENLEGWNPCSKASLKYAGVSRVKELPHEHFELSETWDFGKSAPAEPGYNMYSFGYDLTTLNSDTAIVLEPLNASLHVKLGDTNPFLTMEEEEDAYDEDGNLIPKELLKDRYDIGNALEDDKYIIHVRALVYKKLEMSWIEKDKRLKYAILEDATLKKE